MKLRIRENSVRLRLTRSEVAKFAETGLVENTTEFKDSAFVYALKVSDAEQNIKAKFENGRLEIFVPELAVKSWANTEEVGIAGETETLKILIEKDFACLTAREGEDESDAFPYPKEKEKSC